MKIFITVLLSFIIAGDIGSQEYLWSHDSTSDRNIQSQIDTPESYNRIEIKPRSFAHWLRNLPLKETGSKVFTFDNKLKENQDAHYAVIDINRGVQNLQQCADAVIRLRAEYLYSMNLYNEISFNFTSGDTCSFRKWIDGWRPYVSINNVKWKDGEKKDSSYYSFQQYLKTVFMYAGSYSLEKELLSKRTIENINLGDVFIQGGFPGHAVIVVDVAEQTETGERVFLLAQSYMPAQDIHILQNPNDSELSPWYSVDFGTTLKTPEWVFTDKDLHSFK